MHVLTSPIRCALSLFIHSPVALSPANALAYSQSQSPDMNTLSIRAFIPPLTRRRLPLRATRRYAVQAPGAPTMEIFSNQHKWQQKERAAANTELSRSVDYLRDEVASRLCERILVCGPSTSDCATTDMLHRTSIATSPRCSTWAPMLAI
jgi:hypothetical protein